MEIEDGRGASCLRRAALPVPLSLLKVNSGMEITDVLPATEGWLIAIGQVDIYLSTIPACQAS